MQNAGISPEAVSRKGQEERNKENRQRDSRIMAGLRNGIAERDWWLLRQAPVREDGNDDGRKTICTTVAAFGDCGLWRKARAPFFVWGCTVNFERRSNSGWPGSNRPLFSSKAASMNRSETR